MNDAAENAPRYLVGVDGGGSGTRVAVALTERPEQELGRGHAGPSGLALGVDAAWGAIGAATEAAFAAAGLALEWSKCAMGCGLAGVNHAPWREAFVAAAPALASLRVETDAYSTLLGAHQGAPGVVVALGTGSVGMALTADGTVRMVGGFGFPSGDEASGAALGLKIIVHAQRAVDGRGPRDALAAALLTAVGAIDDGSAAHADGASERERLLHWLVHANQTAYAALAPLVAAYSTHPLASSLLTQAGRDVGAMVMAMDPTAKLPLALSGSLAAVVTPFLPPIHAGRLVPPRGDAVQGALRIARADVAGEPD